MKPLVCNSHCSSVEQLFNEQLVELSAILDSLFHKVFNTMSTPIGVEGNHTGFRLKIVYMP